VGKIKKKIRVPSLAELRERAEQRIDDVIARRFRSACMSNAKWRKTLAKLARSEIVLTSYRWKFVDDEKTIITDVVPEKDLGPCSLYDGRFQPFIYKDIQWLEVITSQPDEAVADVTEIGQFAIERTNEGFLIRGYT
jgi:hypothetical protein